MELTTLAVACNNDIRRFKSNNQYRLRLPTLQYNILRRRRIKINDTGKTRFYIYLHGCRLVFVLEQYIR